MRVRGTSGRSASAARCGGRALAPGTAARGNNSASAKKRITKNYDVAQKFCYRLSPCSMPMMPINGRHVAVRFGEQVLAEVVGLLVLALALKMTDPRARWSEKAHLERSHL